MLTSLNEILSRQISPQRNLNSILWGVINKTEIKAESGGQMPALPKGH